MIVFPSNIYCRLWLLNSPSSSNDSSSLEKSTRNAVTVNYFWINLSNKLPAYSILAFQLTNVLHPLSASSYFVHKPVDPTWLKISFSTAFQGASYVETQVCTHSKRPQGPAYLSFSLKKMEHFERERTQNYPSFYHLFSCYQPVPCPLHFTNLIIILPHFYQAFNFPSIYPLPVSFIFLKSLQLTSPNIHGF